MHNKNSDEKIWILTVFNGIKIYIVTIIRPIKMGWEFTKPKALYIGVYRKSFANITKLATNIIWKKKQDIY